LDTGSIASAMPCSFSETMPVLPPQLAALSHRLLPVDQEVAPPDAHGRQAAVLILLFPEDADIRFPLTVRPESLTRHAGQISLPGGLVESSDGTPWEAALRETREEVGVSTESVVPVGRLATHHLTVSDYFIGPFVGWLGAPPHMHPDPVEVAEIFDVGVADLLDPDSVAHEEWELRGRSWSVTFYRFGGRVVWGATARILYEFACRLEDRPMPQGHVPGSVLPLE